MLEGKSILITGGTGSFGKKFIAMVLKKYPKIEKLVIFSRDELKQYEMSQEFSFEKYKAIRYFLGDIRDLDRLKQALEGIDIVIHAAALKQVPAAEYNPSEFIKTNILGTQNVVDAVLSSGSVTKLIALSTDKASSPANLYGATKLCADKLVIAGNNIKGQKNINFSVVRYGNVLGSRGSVLPAFLKQDKESDFFTITDEDMTRFTITLNEGVNMVLWAIANAIGGEIFVPKIPSYKILDIAAAINSEKKVKIIGIRPGEKLHEEMISVADAENTIDLGKYYAILPYDNTKMLKQYLSHKSLKVKKVSKSFSYSSDLNEDFVSVKELRDMIKAENDSL
jgi:UDP-N-acetylglucosamine 4,6-dehydratase/5-epimerase